MKLERIYAEALAKAEKPDAKSLFAHLQATGRMKLLPGIKRELLRMQERERKLAPKLAVASEAEQAHAKKEAAELGIEAAEVTIDHSLIRGWRATAKGVLVDHSAKRALVDLYRQITK